MVNKIVEGIVGLFGGSTLIGGKQLIVFIISLMPILELRGGLIAASLLKLDPWQSYIISIIGNVLPIPFILWFIKKIINWMRTKKCFKKITDWLDKKVTKNKSSIEKYGFWGLVIFVGIPLPGTGAWTGALIASLLDMNKKKAFLAILLGVFMASIIMMIISFGLIGKIV